VACSKSSFRIVVSLEDGEVVGLDVEPEASLGYPPLAP